jgi:hypothetical protein
MLMLNDTSKLRKFTKSNFHGIGDLLWNPNWDIILPDIPLITLHIFLSIIPFCWCIKQAFNICRVFSIIIFEVKSSILIIILCLCSMMQLMSPPCKWSDPLWHLKTIGFFLSHHDGSLIGCLIVTCLICFQLVFLIQCIGDNVVLAFFMLTLDKCICHLFGLAYQGKDIVFRLIIA